jgi:hypothetical protein
MRVTARDVMAAWVERDPQSPYHIDQKKTVGKDRKSVEGPFPTNEDFPNSWLPTEQPQEMAVQQIEVVKVEQVVVTAGANDMPGLPGVPRGLYLAWENAHDAEMSFAGDYSEDSLDLFVRYLLQMAHELSRLGLQIDPQQLEQLKGYTQRNRPNRGPEGYSASLAGEHLDRLDKVLTRLHGEAARLTNTDRTQWYEYQADQMMGQKPMTQQELRTQRGPGSGFLEDLWNRKRKHELRGMRVAATDVLPGVSQSLFSAWSKAHDAKGGVRAGASMAEVDNLAQAVVLFGKLAMQAGAQNVEKTVQTAANYVNTHPPANQQEYSPGEIVDHLDQLDSMLSSIHQSVLGATGTTRREWYALKDQKSVNDHEYGQVLTPEEQAEMKQMGVPVRLTPQQQQIQRGPFLQDLWERRRMHELRGMRVRAIDVKRPKTKKTKVQPATDEMINEDVQPPQKQPSPVQPHPAVMRTNNMPEGHESVLSQPLSNWDWEDYAPEESGIAGSLFSYQKSVYLYDFDNNPEVDDQSAGGDMGDKRLECYAFVEPLKVRKQRLIEQAARIEKGRDRATWSKGAGDPEAQRLRQEAQNTPDRGYINDIEVFYNDTLLFHRERSFTPRKALTSKEFMAADTLQRAVSDLQQFIRTQLDPTPVGQFIQNALENPGKGTAKLSKKKHVPWWKRYDEWRSKDPERGRLYKEDEEIVVYPKKKHKKGEVMRVTAADVVPFDPSKRRLKSPHVKPKSMPIERAEISEEGEPTFGLGPSKRLQQWFDEQKGKPAMPNLDLPGQGNTEDDYEAMLYMYDNVVGGLDDIAQSMIGLQPSLDPAKQVEAGKMIAKLRAAIRALSA